MLSIVSSQEEIAYENEPIFSTALHLMKINFVLRIYYLIRVIITKLDNDILTKQSNFHNKCA